MSAFLSMGGYAFYVWSSFGLTALVMVMHLVMSTASHRSIRRELIDELADNVAIQRAGTSVSKELLHSEQLNQGAESDGHDTDTTS